MKDIGDCSDFFSLRYCKRLEARVQDVKLTKHEGVGQGYARERVGGYHWKVGLLACTQDKGSAVICLLLFFWNF